MTNSVREDLREWERLLREKSAARTPAKANKAFDAAYAIARDLRDSEEGRRGIEALVDDDDPAVATTAAAQSLAWGSESGIQAMERLATVRGIGGFEARMTLQEYRAGRLTSDWWPRR